MDDIVKKQRFVCVFISFSLCFSPIVSSLNVILNILFAGGSLNTGLLYVIYCVLFAICLFQNIRYVSKHLFISLVLILLSLLFTFFFFPKNSVYMWTSANDFLSNPTYIFLLFNLSAFMVSFYLKDINYFVRVFEKFSYISVALLTIRFFVGFILKSSVPEYMTFSYNLLLSTTFILLLCIYEFKINRLLFSGVGVFLILFTGCRGALIGLIIAVVIYVFFMNNLNKKKKYSLMFVLLLLLFVLGVFYYPIFNALNDKLTGIGLSSRTLEKLLSSSFLDDSSRLSILKKTISQVDFFGHGLWGDRVLLDGKYPHNIVAEILVDYGLILGSAMLIIVFFYIIFGLYKSKNKMCLFLCALISSGFVKLLMSGSFLNQETAFYVLLGICVNICSNTTNHSNFIDE